MALENQAAKPSELEPWAMAWSRIVTRTWMDPHFKNEVLRANSGRLRALCLEMGYEPPADVELEVRQVEGARDVSPTRVSASRIQLPLPSPPMAVRLMIAVTDYVCAGGMSPPFCCC